MSVLVLSLNVARRAVSGRRAAAAVSLHRRKCKRAPANLVALTTISGVGSLLYIYIYIICITYFFPELCAQDLARSREARQRRSDISVLRWGAPLPNKVFFMVAFVLL